MDSRNPSPDMKFYSIDHADGEDPFCTRYSEWRCVDTNRFIGDVPGLSKPAKLILHSGQMPARGRFLIVRNAIATLPVGPLPLPDTVSILLKGRDYSLIQIPFHGNGFALEAEDLLAQVTMLQASSQERLQEAFAIVARHFHVVMFDFGHDDRRGPGKPRPPPDNGGEPVKRKKLLEIA